MTFIYIFVIVVIYTTIGTLIAFLDNEDLPKELKAFMFLFHPIVVIIWAIKGAIIFFKTLNDGNINNN